MAQEGWIIERESSATVAAVVVLIRARLEAYATQAGSLCYIIFSNS